MYIRIFHTFKSSLVTVFAGRRGSHSHGESLGADLAGISPVSPDSGVETQAVPVPNLLPVRVVWRSAADRIDAWQQLSVWRLLA